MNPGKIVTVGTTYWKIGYYEGDYYVFVKHITGTQLGGVQAEIEAINAGPLEGGFWSEKEAEDYCEKLNQHL